MSDSGVIPTYILTVQTAPTMKRLLVLLFTIIYTVNKKVSINETLDTNSTLTTSATYEWIRSVSLFRKQNPCSLNLSGNNFQQLSILLILGGQVELNPGPKAKYPCQICNRAIKCGQKDIACDNCDLWYHQPCMSMNSYTYLKLENTSIACLCKVCNTPNHSSVLYTSIMSDDNQFSSLSGNETNSINIDNLSSLNNNIFTINSPLASSSPKQHNTSETT